MNDPNKSPKSPKSPSPARKKTKKRTPNTPNIPKPAGPPAPEKNKKAATKQEEDPHGLGAIKTFSHPDLFSPSEATAKPNPTMTTRAPPPPSLPPEATGSDPVILANDPLKVPTLSPNSQEQLLQSGCQVTVEEVTTGNSNNKPPTIKCKCKTVDTPKPADKKEGQATSPPPTPATLGGPGGTVTEDASLESLGFGDTQLPKATDGAGTGPQASSLSPKKQQKKVTPTTPKAAANAKVSPKSIKPAPETPPGPSLPSSAKPPSEGGGSPIKSTKSKSGSGFSDEEERSTIFTQESTASEDSASEKKQKPQEGPQFCEYSTMTPSVFSAPTGKTQDGTTVPSPKAKTVDGAPAGPQDPPKPLKSGSSTRQIRKFSPTPSAQEKAAQQKQDQQQQPLPPGSQQEKKPTSIGKRAPFPGATQKPASMPKTGVCQSPGAAAAVSKSKKQKSATKKSSKKLVGGQSSAGGAATGAKPSKKSPKAKSPLPNIYKVAVFGQTNGGTTAVTTPVGKKDPADPNSSTRNVIHNPIGEKQGSVIFCKPDISKIEEDMILGITCGGGKATPAPAPAKPPAPAKDAPIEEKSDSVKADKADPAEEEKEQSKSKSKSKSKSQSAGEIKSKSKSSSKKKVESDADADADATPTADNNAAHASKAPDTAGGTAPVSSSPPITAANEQSPAKKGEEEDAATIAKPSDAPPEKREEAAVDARFEKGDPATTSSAYFRAPPPPSTTSLEGPSQPSTQKKAQTDMKPEEGVEIVAPVATTPSTSPAGTGITQKAQADIKPEEGADIVAPVATTPSLAGTGITPEAAVPPNTKSKTKSKSGGCHRRHHSPGYTAHITHITIRVPSKKVKRSAGNGSGNKPPCSPKARQTQAKVVDPDSAISPPPPPGTQQPQQQQSPEATKQNPAGEQPKGGDKRNNKGSADKEEVVAMLAAVLEHEKQQQQNPPKDPPQADSSASKEKQKPKKEEATAATKPQDDPKPSADATSGGVQKENPKG